MSTLSRFGLLSIVGFGLSLMWVRGLNASEDQLQPIDPNIIRICVNRLLYDHTFSDGTPAGERTIIDPRAASVACRGVKFEEEALAVRQCVNGLLYNMTFSDGKPVGERTILDPMSAAQACSFCKARY